MEHNDDLNVNRGEMEAIIRHFIASTIPVTQNVIKEFCNVKGFKVVTLGAYEDFKFQYEHDRRLEALVPAIMEAFLKYRNVPELAKDDERKKIIDANTHLSTEIAKLMEDHGILYQEIDLVTETLGSVIKAIFTDAGKRANNMCSTMLAHTAREKYGETLALKTLGEAYRKIAKEKGVAEGLK